MKMKAKESKAPESRLQAPSFKHRPTNRLSHPEPGSSLTFDPCYTRLYMWTSFL